VRLRGEVLNAGGRERRFLLAEPLDAPSVIVLILHGIPPPASVAADPRSYVQRDRRHDRDLASNKRVGLISAGEDVLANLGARAQSSVFRGKPPPRAGAGAT
jgi:hypothetical protein